LYTLIKVFRRAKYGNAVFKVQSSKYRTGLNSKKEISMTVKPFKYNNTVYLPVTYVMKALGIKNAKNQGQETIIKYSDKIITISENLITVCETGVNTCEKMSSEIKYMNNEMMIPLVYCKDMFDVSTEYNKITDEIVLW
jgi:hypothetical protein